MAEQGLRIAGCRNKRSAIPELVIHGKGGFLCEIGNATDFTEKINLLAEAKDLRRKWENSTAPE
jgi:glycosyltransferase involved in cell wall biosynthesis